MNQPPYYILLSHSAISTANSGAQSSALGHPTIQYHYANDSPLALWPQHVNEHVIVLDHSDHKPPTVQSLSKDLVVTSLKIEEAPGAAAANESDPKNDRMYIIETTATDGRAEIPAGDRKSANNVVMQFKRRNAILRRALLFPDTSLFDHPPILHESSPRPAS